MMFTTTQELQEVIGGVDIFSANGILILSIGILFTIGVPLLMIFQGRKD